MSSCCVVNCSTAYKKKEAGVKFFNFPWKAYEADLRERWIKAVNRENPDGSLWRPRKTSRVCSKHFPNGMRSNIWSHPASVPSIFPEVYRRNTSEQKEQKKAERHQRLMKRRQLPPEPDIPEPHKMDEVDNVAEASTQDVSLQVLMPEIAEKPSRTFTFFTDRISDCEVGVQCDLPFDWPVSPRKVSKEMRCGAGTDLSVFQKKNIRDSRRDTDRSRCPGPGFRRPRAFRRNHPSSANTNLEFKLIDLTI